MDTSPATLRNKGVPVTLVGSDGESLEVHYVRFNFNSIVELEDAFGGINEFEREMQNKPFSATRKALAVALGMPVADLGERMRMEDMGEYAAGVTMAWGMANGLDPTLAAMRLDQATKEMAKTREEMAEAQRAELEKATTEAP